MNANINSTQSADANFNAEVSCEASADANTNVNIKFLRIIENADANTRSISTIDCMPRLLHD